MAFSMRVIPPVDVLPETALSRFAGRVRSVLFLGAMTFCAFAVLQHVLSPTPLSASADATSPMIRSSTLRPTVEP